MKYLSALALALALLPTTALSCTGGGCYGPVNHVEHVRHVKRMQPDALNATYGPKKALEWGQLNILHTTDTHGWLEGHLKERNYGADWGDFVSFSTRLKHQAGNMGVDILLVDTGDLHDGAGLSDVTDPDGEVSITIFDDVDYDLLAIGNHELYLADVAYQTLNKISAYWGEKYLTSNVQIMNQETGEWQYIGKTHRYFTTEHGLRIMAFGVLFDFTGNANGTKVIPAKTMITQTWFKDAIDTDEPIDVFVLIGHNPVRDSSFQTVWNAIRAVHAETPIQILGGHSHIRDFVVYDESSVAMESGRYCETLGWLSMSGFTSDNSGFNGIFPNPVGVSNPTRKATEESTSPYTYSRRYLDWNRKTFMYHAATWYDPNLDYNNGLETSAKITQYRHQFNLSQLLGCVPQDYCVSCVPFNDARNIFTLLAEAAATVVVKPERSETARYIISNTGSVRFDMYKGPFTNDDNYIVSPFQDAFLYLADVPFAQASTVFDELNRRGASGKKKKRSDLGTMSTVRDICVDPIVGMRDEGLFERHGDAAPRGITRRQVVDLVPGYTTTDDWGSDGDDTEHSRIPGYKIPDFFRGAAGFDENGQADVVDIVFVDFIENDVLAILGENYTSADVDYYISANYTTRDYLPQFVLQSDDFQADVPNCPTT
ncbi:ser/Thr protein phosphatase family [Poronia punctata]|nr:ser/Thr protein phosphatase family [Poronia punctata]